MLLGFLDIGRGGGSGINVGCRLFWYEKDWFILCFMSGEFFEELLMLLYDVCWSINGFGFGGNMFRLF